MPTIIKYLEDNVWQTTDNFWELSKRPGFHKLIFYMISDDNMFRDEE
jgi:hypothetical protein